MKNEKDCRECEIEFLAKKIDSWALSILCGVLSGVVGTGIGVWLFSRFFA